MISIMNILSWKWGFTTLHFRPSDAKWNSSPPTQTWFFFRLHVLTNDIRMHLVLAKIQASPFLSFIFDILGWFYPLNYCSSVNFFLTSPPSILGQDSIFPGFCDNLPIESLVYISSPCALADAQYCKETKDADLVMGLPSSLSHCAWDKDQNVSMACNTLLLFYALCYSSRTCFLLSMQPAILQFLTLGVFPFHLKVIEFSFLSG